MTLRRTAIVLGVLWLALPAFAAAQGLGDAAAREKAKRQAAKKPAGAKVFTNDDLAQGRPPGTASADGAGASPASPPSEAAPPASDESSSGPEASRREAEQSYTDALTEAQSRVAGIEARIRELQAKLNPMSTTFIYGDFNVGGNKLAEEAEVKAELAQAEGELNAARRAVVDATRAHEDVRQGRPPGPRVPQ